MCIRDRTATEEAALSILADWDGSANGAGADWTFDFEGTPATVGAAATIFHRIMLALPDELFEDLRLTDSDYDFVAEQTSMGRHFYDMSPVLNLALRVLDPETSTLTPAADYAAGRSTDAVLHAVLAKVVDALSAEQGADPSTWRSDYGSMEPICAPVGGTIGPCPLMPLLERGSWVHLVGYAGAGEPSTPAPTEPPADGTDDGSDESPLPATGGGLALAGVVAALAAAGARRRR